VTIDHAVSMSIPALGGWLWAAKGFPYVFVVAAVLAAFNVIAAGFIRIPKRPQGSTARAENQAESTPGGHE
jgi:hypothetical protein